MEQQAKTTEILAVGDLIISVIKNETAGKVFPLPADVDFEKLYLLCERHKVTPLIADAVLKCSHAPDEIKGKFKKELFRASMRYESQCREKELLSAEFCKRNIKHCFLKGVKIAKYYRKPELRYMLDMDIYVDEKRFKDVQQIMLERGYSENSFGADDKDAGYIKKPFLNAEIHRELKYDYDKGYSYYKGAFERLVPEENGYTLNMTNEDFYVYILSHSAHHFAFSGTGIRNILDHYYLKNNLKPLCDNALLQKNLEETGLSVFSQKLDLLAEFWFGDGEKTGDVSELSDYVILSGVFGNETNYHMSSILRGDYGDKKSSFILARLFPSADKISPRYPILKKAPFLLPFVWLVRILSAIFGKKDVSGEIKGFEKASKENTDEFSAFMKKNGL